MKKVLIVLSAIAFSAGAAYAANDAIAARQALMDANGAAAGLSAAMLKGEMPYDAAAAKSAIATFRATSTAAGAFFPEGSDKGETAASPKIWSDHEGFEKALAKFNADAEAAMKAAGKKGPVDLAAFKTAVVPVLQNCKSCHEDFRIKR